MTRSAIVCGSSGFIGQHLVKRLKAEGYHVLGFDRQRYPFGEDVCDQFLLVDLTYRLVGYWQQHFRPGDEVYQLAAEMGGAEYIFTGKHDAAVMANSVKINLNVLEACVKARVAKVFFSSSACIYPDFVQLSSDHCELHEGMAYPARPDSEYGWEKLFSERLYAAYSRNCGLVARVARLHNVFGPCCTYQGGREKAPAAICRKVAAAKSGDTIKVFGTGQQTRSFLYIDECIDGIRRFTDSNFAGPVNLGSAEMVSIDTLVQMVAQIAGKTIHIEHIEGPIGVNGRTSNNELILEKLGWQPTGLLYDGLEQLYAWVEGQVQRDLATEGA